MSGGGLPTFPVSLPWIAGHRLSPATIKTIVVTRCGRICLGKKKINFSQVFAGQAVGIKEVHDDIWLVSFMDYDLGYFDLETRVLEPLENPFGPKVLPMS
jgi:putative transposase